MTSPGWRVPAGSLRAGVAWAAIGSGIYLACQYGMLIVIAKYATRTNVGEFAMAQAISAPFMILSQMQLRQLQVTDVQRSMELGDYMMARALATGLALVGIAIVTAIIGYTGQMAVVLAVVALAKATESMSDIAHGHMQREERLDLVAVSLALKGIVSLAMMATVLIVTGNFIASVIAMAVTWLAILLLFDLPYTGRLRAAGERMLAWRPRVLRTLAWTALPLAIASGLVSLSGNLPRYFLDTVSGKDAVALFTVAATPLMLVGLINNAVAQATLPRAAGYFQGGQLDGFMRIARWIVALQVFAGLALAAIFWLFGPAIMRLLFTPEYEAASGVAVLLALGISLNGLAGYGSTVIAAARRFWLQLGNIVLALVIQLPLCMILIPGRGIIGAGIVEIVKYAVATIYLTAAGYIVHRQRADRLARTSLA